jgi:hypothetical protein
MVFLIFARSFGTDRATRRFSLGTARRASDRSAAGLFIGAAVAGAGVGAGNLGAYRTLTALTAAHHRAGTIAAIFTIGYLALSVPVLIAGVGTMRFGLHRTALVYCAAVAALSAAAATSFIVRRPPPAKGPGRDSLTHLKR